MSDAARLHQVILSQLLKLLPDMLEDNRLTLALLITGLLRARSGQLKKIARAVSYAHKKESLVERFRRLVKNGQIVPQVEYNPFVGLILAALSQEKLVLMIDSTKIGGACICLMVSVYYKSRALPLAWVVYKGKKGHSSQETQLDLFKTVQALLPPTSPVILVGDGEFDGSEVVTWFKTETTWQYACRTDRTNLIWSQAQWQALNQLPLTSGEDGFLSGVRFTQAHQVGPVNILIAWNAAQKCHWFFVTNFDTQAEAQKWYRKRFTTETLFSDFKGRGFHLHETRLWIPARVNRLVLAAAMAYVFTILWGVESIVSGAFRQVVRADAFYHSLFQLGLIYLDHLLNEYLSFPELLTLPRPDSFEHVVIT
jgi:DDE family transposase